MTDAAIQAEVFLASLTSQSSHRDPDVALMKALSESLVEQGFKIVGGSADELLIQVEPSSMSVEEAREKLKPLLELGLQINET